MSRVILIIALMAGCIYQEGEQYSYTVYPQDGITLTLFRLPTTELALMAQVGCPDLDPQCVQLIVQTATGASPQSDLYQMMLLDPGALRSVLIERIQDGRPYCLTVWDPVDNPLFWYLDDCLTEGRTSRR